MNDVSVLSTVIMASLAIQGAAPATSSHVRERVTGRVGQASISVEYDRPRLEGKTVAQGGPKENVFPVGAICRLGYPQSALLSTDRLLNFPGLEVPAGSYTVFVRPSASDYRKWQLVFNKSQNVTASFQFDQELGSTVMTVSETADSEDQLTLAVDTAGKGGVFTIKWGRKTATVTFSVSTP